MYIRDNQEEEKMRLLQELARKIKESNGDKKYIELISRQIVCGKGQLDDIQITKIFQSFLTNRNYSVQLQLNVLQIMTQILLQNKATNYIRHFSPRFKFFLQKNALFIKLKPETLSKAHEIFQTWKKNKIFSEKFYKMLVDAAGPIFQAEDVEEKESFVFTKYTKSYLMGLRDIKKVPGANLTYNECIKMHQLKPVIERIEKQAKQVQYNTERSAQRREKAVQLSKEIEETIDKYINIMNDIQIASLTIKQLFMQEVNYLNMTKEELCD